MSPERDEPSSGRGGSFGRDPGTQTIKAVVLVAVVVIVGFVVLKNVGSGSKAIKVASPATHVPTTKAAAPTVTTPTTTAPPNPATIKVLVLNGTSTPNAATYFTNKLHAAGYNTLAPGDATSLTVTTTMVYVNAPGKSGTQVAQSLGLGPTSVANSVPANAPISSALIKQDTPDVVVLIGKDISSQALSASSTTTTTGAKSSTT